MSDLVQKTTKNELSFIHICSYMAVCQNLVPLVNIKIAGKWMFIPLKMVLIGIDPYPYIYNRFVMVSLNIYSAQESHSSIMTFLWTFAIWNVSPSWQAHIMFFLVISHENPQFYPHSIPRTHWFISILSPFFMDVKGQPIHKITIFHGETKRFIDPLLFGVNL